MLRLDRRSAATIRLHYASSVGLKEKRKSTCRTLLADSVRELSGLASGFQLDPWWPEHRERKWSETDVNGTFSFRGKRCHSTQQFMMVVDFSESSMPVDRVSKQRNLTWSAVLCGQVVHSGTGSLSSRVKAFLAVYPWFGACRSKHHRKRSTQRSELPCNCCVMSVPGE